jgi:hypothetical protein
METHNKPMSIYLVYKVEQQISTSVYDQDFKPMKVDLRWAEGMIGVMPVFSNLEAAETYAERNRYSVSELEIVPL